MDSTAVNAIGQLAIEAESANHLATDTPAVILRADQKVFSLEYLQPGRSRYRGAFATQNLQAFAEHVITTVENNPSDGAAQGFIDTDKMAAAVFFNLGDAEHPGHGDHIAKLTLKPTAAYAALCKAAAGNLDQRTLHDFIEDWREQITVLYDGQPRDNGIPAALAAVRDISIEAARKVQHVERDFGATKSAMETVDAASSLTLPSGFTFRTVPYEGLQERTLRLRLGVNTGSDKPILILRVQQAEQTIEDIAKDFRDRLAALLGASSTLTLGTFTP